MDNSQKDNKSYISQLSEEEITSLLLRGFSSTGLSGFTPLLLTNEPSVPLQLQYLFEELEPIKQEEFKKATVRAIQEWKLLPHGTEALKDLAFLASCIRASRAIQHLRGYLEGAELKALDEQEYRDTVSLIISVLQGFTPSDEVKDLFERLLYNNQFKRFAAQLLIGLCKCQPNEYPHYLQRFLDIEKVNPEYFRLDFIIRKFERTVTLKTIVDNSQKLDPAYLERFFNLLCLQPWSSVELLPPDPETSRLFLVSKKTLAPLFLLPTNVQEILFEKAKFIDDIIDNKFEGIQNSGGVQGYIDRNILQAA